MRRRHIALCAIAAIAGAGAAAYWWLAPFGGTSAATFSGYVEADYVMVASAVGGTVVALDVARGDRVAAGARLFALDDAATRAARDEAAARLRQTVAQLADLRLGRRPAEIQAIVAQRDQAEALRHLSETEYERTARLRASGTAAARQLDDALMQRDRARARVRELDAQLSLARLPARADEIAAAEAAVDAARAALAQADWRQAQMIGTAPADATVVDTLYRPGETVPAAQPAVQLLPPANLKLRFFVPEGAVAGLAVGAPVTVRCDGCGDDFAATVSYIAPRAEFTPPVIYSRTQRARLVFMVEARPQARLGALPVGLPVDVTVDVAPVPP